ncbi:MAG TPA: sigma 54-interacting transcriptional regulator [Kofleriaceae bacterium]|nr:sigma 54-interacting transcriptional regulator [Kofleriaceae bacterium]
MLTVARASQLSAALFGATTFDEAAQLTLRALLDLAMAQLAASPWARTGRIMRAIVHHRLTDGYRRLMALDAQPGEDAIAGAIMPSASAGRWIAEHRVPVAVDLHTGVVRLCTDGSFTGELRAGTAPMTHESRIRMLAREASHLLLVPLRVPGGAVAGMLSIEANCLAAIDGAFIWPELVAEAQLYAEVAAPHLAALPTEARPLATTDPYLPVIGASMAPLVEMLRIFAEQEETVLLTGPTGAGKSRLARWCHHRSRRANGPFEILELATVPEELQLAELFGWKRGAFTGAARDTEGAITRAATGTLFIDEIDKLSLRAQAGLLRVFEERRYRPLGEGSGDRSADVRFIVGTNANVRELVKSGQFREDLYYRINVLPVQVPPLAERRDELPAWARHMLRRRHEAGRGDATPGEVHLSPEAIDRLLAQTWPGNLRQLDNIVRRAYTLSLLEAGGGRELTLEASHVERALSLEGRADGPPLVELMTLAAEAFVGEAQRAEGSASPLKLDHADALRGMILAAAVRRLRSKEDAFRLFGKETTVSSRNHNKVLRTELARIAALREALGLPPDPELAALQSPTSEG